MDGGNNFKIYAQRPKGNDAKGEESRRVGDGEHTPLPGPSWARVRCLALWRGIVWHKIKHQLRQRHRCRVRTWEKAPLDSPQLGATWVWVEAPQFVAFWYLFWRRMWNKKRLINQTNVVRPQLNHAKQTLNSRNGSGTALAGLLLLLFILKWRPGPGASACLKLVIYDIAKELHLWAAHTYTHTHAKRRDCSPVCATNRPTRWTWQWSFQLRGNMIYVCGKQAKMAIRSRDSCSNTWHTFVKKK